MIVRALKRGIATYITGRHKPTGTISARYCYSVWLRHLSMAYKYRLSTIPEVIAELGPGDSLGVGLASLLTGANKYYALDVAEYANSEKNIEIMDEIVRLLSGRASIPDDRDLPNVKPYLKSYDFPHEILPNRRLSESLKPERIAYIKKALQDLGQSNSHNTWICYAAPWYDSAIMQEESIDMIYSQAVLEHIHELAATYKLLHRWLRPGGFMSHQIDFRCHDLAREWNGHWAYSDFEWWLARGRRPYLINRQPHSAHIKLIMDAGFDIVCDIRTKNTSGIKRQQLAKRFKNMSEDDLTTSGAFIQAVKRRSDKCLASEASAKRSFVKEA